MRMKFTTNWARSPHQLDLVHIEREFNHLPDQPCIFHFLSDDRLAIQFPMTRVEEDKDGNVVAAPSVRVREPQCFQSHCAVRCAVRLGPLSRSIVQPSHCTWCLGWNAQPSRMGGDAHMERVVLSRVVQGEMPAGDKEEL